MSHLVELSRQTQQVCEMATDLHFVQTIIISRVSPLVFLYWLEQSDKFGKEILRGQGI